MIDNRDIESQVSIQDQQQIDQQSQTQQRTSLSIQSNSDESIEPDVGENVVKYALYALRFAVLIDAINTTILEPNFPFLVLAGSNPDSFPSTAPLGFGAAQYFLPMTSYIGTAIASTFIGILSDKYGRRPCILACLGLGCIGSIIMYLLRFNFWFFCLANFMNGLFGASLPVAVAYVSDVKSTRAEKDVEMNINIALHMMGRTGGGVIAIAMAEKSLFESLFVGSALSAFAFAVAWLFLGEPKKMLQASKDSTMKDLGTKEKEDFEDSLAPSQIDWKVVTNVLFGAIADNFGSAGLFPICLSPLALEVFQLDLINMGETPLMSEFAFKWILVLLSLMVIPAAVVAPNLFNKIGTPATCILGNTFTSIAIISLLYIALITPATQVTYIGFMVVLYIGYPFTVLSQLTTGPMLDALAPSSQRGLLQGLNMTTMNFAGAISPFLFGLLSDYAGTFTTIWTCVGISFCAALVNIPLMFVTALKRPKNLDDISVNTDSSEPSEDNEDWSITSNDVSVHIDSSKASEDGEDFSIISKCESK
jgi:MFS family permease